MRIVIRQPACDDISVELPDRPLTNYLQLEIFEAAKLPATYDPTDTVPHQRATFRLIGIERFADGEYPVYELLM